LLTLDILDIGDSSGERLHKGYLPARARQAFDSVGEEYSQAEEAILAIVVKQ
jgi:hypothetical protein